MSTEPGRQLPGHIAAALAGAGGAGDSAGQPWAGRTLPDGQPYHAFADDDGAMDAAVAAALQALAEGNGTEADVLTALANARVFIPIVAQLAESAAGEFGVASDKESDMALVTVQAPDGRRALPAFTNAGALAQWHDAARPIAVHAPRAALSAVAEDAQLMVLDPGTARPFVVRRPALWALAQQKEWLPSYADPRVQAILAESVAAAANPAIRGISATAGRGIESNWNAEATSPGALVAGGGPGPELAVRITLAPGLDQAAVTALVGTLQTYWAADGYFAQAVDSIQIRLQGAAT